MLWNGTVPPETKDVLLLIADISGYTRFMLANQTELAHSHEIISALLQALIAEVEIPLSIAKLKGDALFLYLDKGAEPDAVRRVEAKLLRFFEAFSSTLRGRATTRTCSCGACRNTGSLRLKVVVHSGTALVYSIAQRTELAGIDVIIVHRLLKNSVTAREYILLTDAAKYDIHLDLPIICSGVEEVDGIGTVGVTAFRIRDHAETGHG